MCVYVLFLQDLQKGNVEGARIHGENAIRQKNQASYDRTCVCVCVGVITVCVCVCVCITGTKLFENECESGWSGCSCPVSHSNETGMLTPLQFIVNPLVLLFVCVNPLWCMVHLLYC